VTRVLEPQHIGNAAAVTYHQVFTDFPAVHSKYASISLPYIKAKHSNSPKNKPEQPQQLAHKLKADAGKVYSISG